MALPRTGDQTQRETAVNAQVAFTGLASVTTAELADKTHPINNNLISGKKAGALVYNSTTKEIIAASGSTDVAPWGTAAQNTAVITPV